MRSHGFTIAIALGTVVAGCSVINSLDEVVQGGTGGAGLTAVTTPAGSGAGGPGGGGGTTTSTGGGGSGGGVLESVVVVAGVTDGDTSDHRLVTLDGASGETLADEALLVTSAVYDAERELWFIFETSNEVPDPSTTATLHARSFDRDARTWTTLSTLEVQNLAPISHRHLTALNDKLTFAHFNDTSPFDVQLSTIDTSDPAAMMVEQTVTIEEANMETLGVMGSANAAGGTVNVVRNESSGGACRINLRLVNVTGTMTTVTATTFVAPGTYSCTATTGPPPFPGWSVNVQSQGDAVLVVPSDPPNVVTYNMSTFTNNEIDLSALNIQGRRFLDVDVAPCQNTALFVEHLTDQRLYAVPLVANGTATSTNLAHPGQGIVFDPYTDRALDFFNIGQGFDLKAFALGGTSTEPSLSVVNQGWSPPDTLRPRFTIVRDTPCPN